MSWCNVNYSVFGSNLVSLWILEIWKCLTRVPSHRLCSTFVASVCSVRAMNVIQSFHRRRHSQSKWKFIFLEIFHFNEINCIKWTSWTRWNISRIQILLWNSPRFRSNVVYGFSKIITGRRNTLQFHIEEFLRCVQVAVASCASVNENTSCSWGITVVPLKHDFLLVRRDETRRFQYLSTLAQSKHLVNEHTTIDHTRETTRLNGST